MSYDYVSRTWKAKAWQWQRGINPPQWVQEYIDKGDIYICDWPAKGYCHISITGNKRGEYKARPKDWIVLDEFKHLHVISEKTFSGRYKRIED